MYRYADESGNTGIELFDPNQPILYYGLIIPKANLDVVALPLLEAVERSSACRGSPPTSSASGACPRWRRA